MKEGSLKMDRENVDRRVIRKVSLKDQKSDFSFWQKKG